MNHTNEVSAGAQKLLMEAGYQPKAEWVFIDDLVLDFRNKFEGREDLVAELERFLSNGALPVNRSRFKAFFTEVQHRERVRRDLHQQHVNLTETYTKSGIKEPDAGHEALALRILELETAVQAYADRLKSAQAKAANQKSDSSFPFVAGVVVGGILF
jgi:hypothetical protein